MDLLLVDDDADFRTTIAARFRRRGHQVAEAAGADEALALIERQHFDVAVLDRVLPGMDGIDLLEKLKAADPDCQVIIFTGQGTIQTAVEAMRRGAYDYLTKPSPFEELEVLVAKARERADLGRENRRLKNVLRRTQPQQEIVGRSPAMREVLRLIGKAAGSDSSVLITGESGTGKELVARALHAGSPRCDKPMVVINCAALQETLLESELFGHEKGAFTGAVAAKPGLFEIAHGGTLFIDEIGEMAGGLQAKLLRVLEDGRFRPVGSVRERRADVRVVAATNRDLAKEVAAGRFRDDLYYRINVLTIHLPPLRERPGDIPLLIDHFLNTGKGGPWEIDPEARALMERYPWPGNVRELANVIERAKILSEDRLVLPEDLPPHVVSGRPDGLHAASPVRRTTEQSSDELALLERRHVEEVLHREGGNKARAARALGISRRSLYRLLEKYAAAANSA